MIHLLQEGQHKKEEKGILDDSGLGNDAIGKI
jgi:hypothetical protein